MCSLAWSHDSVHCSALLSDVSAWPKQSWPPAVFAATQFPKKSSFPGILFKVVFEVCCILCVFWLSHSKQLLLKAHRKWFVVTETFRQQLSRWLLVAWSLELTLENLNVCRPLTLNNTAIHRDHILRGRPFTLWLKVQPMFICYFRTPHLPVRVPDHAVL